ncbi:MAG TPA: hypothetical protein EYO33_22840, partial [Phycisphaerales bacterium]|nr:hypothetical protein [Phycisphaerales bacterium]
MSRINNNNGINNSPRPFFAQWAGQQTSGVSSYGSSNFINSRGHFEKTLYGMRQLNQGFASFLGGQSPLGQNPSRPFWAQFLQSQHPGTAVTMKFPSDAEDGGGNPNPTPGPGPIQTMKYPSDNEDGGGGPKPTPGPGPIATMKFPSD